MKLTYIANSRIPTEKAHGLQIMKMCERFAKHADTELVLPRRLNPIKDDPFDYHDASKSFKIKYLPVLDLVKLGRIGFWIESLFFSLSAVFYFLFKKTDIIYGRDELPLFFVSFFKKNIFWEAHQGRINFVVRRLLKKAAGVVAISNGLKDFYLRRGAKEEKTMVAPDAVEFDTFNFDMSKLKAREKLGLPPDKKIVLYSGHLYEWKGADLLLDAAKQHSTFNNQYSILFVFVGGTEEDIKNYKLQTINNKLENVLFAGHRPHQEIPFWLKAADILILPNSAKEEISRFFTSPMKLFEYMASGAPIIASDLPSIREVVGERDVLFFKPDDAQDLAEKIKYALNHEDETRAKVESARQKVQNYTWVSRAENIFYFISKNLNAKAKSDLRSAFIAGLGIALLSLPILKNISFLPERAGFLALWLLFMPFGSAFGIYIARMIGRKKPIIFQIAKYGLIGLLNVFMYAGIFNLISWFTGIAAGFAADLFLFISFAITTTNAFFWNKTWTFQSGFNGESRKEYIRFFTITGLTTFLNIVLFHLMVNTVGAPEGVNEKLWANIAIFILIPVSFLGNFFGYRLLVFKPKVSDKISQIVS